MMRSRPVLLILIGFVLVVLGAVLPLLMVLKVIRSTFTLDRILTPRLRDI